MSGNRYVQWMHIKETMDPKSFGHDCMQLPSFSQFKQSFTVSQKNSNQLDSYVRSLSLNICGCNLCLDYAKLHMFETQMELIAKTVECQKLSEQISQLSKTEARSRIRKKVECITATCRICQKPAKSNAKLCHDKNCYNARKTQVRKQHIREKKPISALCVICGKVAKDNKAKICREKVCYNTHEPVAVKFRYCPYLIFRTLQEAKFFHFTHSDVVQLTPLHGFTLEKISFHRVFVPIRKHWERAKKEIDVLDYHHTLITQMLLVLGLKPLDVVDCGSVVIRSRHTNVDREYDIQTRLSADRRLQFPIIIEPQYGILCTRPTIMSFDIEAYSSDGSFPNASNSHAIAICYSLQELDGTIMKEEKLVHKTEIDLLLGFHDAVIKHDPDFITGWNTQGFDWPYLLERAKRIQVPNFAYLDKVKLHKVHIWYDEPQFVGRMNFDAMSVVRKHKERVSVNSNKPESYRLDYIAKLVLNKGKEDLSIPEMRKAFERGDMDVIGNYCLTDAKLPLEILLHENLVNMQLQVAALSGACLRQSFRMTNSSLVSASLSFALHNNYIYDLPRPIKHTEQFQGAFVFEPKPGLYNSLGILDFASLYPSIIIGYNICFTTLITNEAQQDESDTVIELPGGRTARFTTKRRGLVPQMLQQFIDKRNAVKKQMAGSQDQVLDGQQQGIKTICNSHYGVLGASGLFGLRILAEAVTAFGRWAVQKAQKHLEDQGFSVRMMDTDSCFFEIPESVSVEKTPDFCKQQAKEISTLFDNKLVMQYEKQLRPALVFKKKMYAGHDPDKKELMLKGLGAKRRNITPFTRETFQHTLKLLCKKGDIQQAFQYVVGRFDVLVNNISKIPLEEFALTCAIKHLKDYKGTPSIGFRVNQKLEHPLSPGDRIEYLFYYASTDSKHNTSKSALIDKTIPIVLMRQNLNYVVDVDKILEEHYRELRQYFATVSNTIQFDALYAETQRKVREQRGCYEVSQFDITFLNL